MLKQEGMQSRFNSGCHDCSRILIFHHLFWHGHSGSAYKDNLDTDRVCVVGSVVSDGAGG